MKNCILNARYISLELTAIHFNVANGVKFSSTVRQQMKEFGAAITMPIPMLL